HKTHHQTMKIESTKNRIAFWGGSMALISGIVATQLQASGDYGPAIWRQACGGHWYTSGNGKRFYVIHDMEGYYLSTISYFQNYGTSASIHYCVYGQTAF